MSSTWGNNIKITIYGESHGVGIGAVMDGVPAGVAIDIDAIQREMARRQPGQNKMSTARKEADQPEILSGLFEGRTTGAPIMMTIYNQDMRSKDYSKTKDLARPGHADYTGYVKYKGFNDYRGGGKFSGRITAGLVFCGAIAKQILATQGIEVGAHIQQIGAVKDTSFDAVKLQKETFKSLSLKALPVLDDACMSKMEASVLEARKQGDSLGGMIECAILGLPVGLGDPFFDSVESRIAHLVFSVPAVKGIEFGLGFDFADAKGSEVNDPYCVSEDKILTTTNHNGGILGGISTGMPIVFRVPIKPTPSISKEQQSVNFKTKEPMTLQIEGRHDPCIVQRAVVIIEAIAALAVLDML